MRNFGLLCAFLAVSSAASCYNLNYAGLTFQCDPTQPGGAVCPDGYQCDATQNLCVLTPAGSDMSMMSNMNMDMSGMPTQDMSGMPASDMGSSPSGCASGTGSDVTLSGHSKVYACPATFSSTGQTASQLCNTGYTLCSVATNADLTKCGMLSGFFLANTYGVVDTQGNNNFHCAMANVSGGFVRIWYGCGGSTTGKSAGTNTCGGFNRYLDCSSPGSYTCGNGTTLDTNSNNSATNGVLCCAP